MRSFLHRILPCGLVLALIAGAASAEIDFIRVKQDDKASMLQTAVTQFKKGDATVDLIGAIHIADAKYYQDLNKKFEAYDRLLFEMIGGDVLKARPGAHAVKGGENLSTLMKIYNVSADFLKLVGQLDAIDYQAKNFVHADLTVAEFQRLQKERKESLVGFMFEAGVMADGAAVDSNSFKLLGGLLRRDADAVKRELLPVLAMGDEQMAAIEGENVILTDRNKRCLEVVAREVAAGHKKVGVFYGAAHYPDMVERIKEMGYKQVGQEWITAWSVPKKEE